jgi:hypothetical protein
MERAPRECFHRHDEELALSFRLTQRGFHVLADLAGDGSGHESADQQQHSANQHCRLCGSADCRMGEVQAPTVLSSRRQVA